MTTLRTRARRAAAWLTTMAYRHLPWFLWRRSVWITDSGEQIVQWDPFWRRRCWAENQAEFSHWQDAAAGRRR